MKKKLGCKKWSKTQMQTKTTKLRTWYMILRTVTTTKVVTGQTVSKRCPLTCMKIANSWLAAHTRSVADDLTLSFRCRRASRRRQADHDGSAAERLSAGAAGWRDHRRWVQGASATLQCELAKKKSRVKKKIENDYEVGWLLSKTNANA